MKVRVSVKPMCSKCKMSRMGKSLRVRCIHTKHNQRSKYTKKKGRR